MPKYKGLAAKQPTQPLPAAPRPRIYIAGPFRAATPYEQEENIRRAEEYGLQVGKLGAIPVIMHTMYRHFQGALPDDFWLEAGISELRTCHALALYCGCERDRTPTWRESQGTCGEVEEARRLGIPVFGYRFGDARQAEMEGGQQLWKWIEHWRNWRKGE